MLILGVVRRGVCASIRWLEGVKSHRDFFFFPPCGVGVSVPDSLWGVSTHPVWVGVSPVCDREGDTATVDSCTLYIHCIHVYSMNVVADMHPSPICM